MKHLDKTILLIWLILYQRWKLQQEKSKYKSTKSVVFSENIINESYEKKSFLIKNGKLPKKISLMFFN